MRLRIGIDCHILGKQKGGVETVVEALVRGLARIDSSNTYFLYVTGHHPFRAGDLPKNFHLRRLPSSSPALGRLLLLPFYYIRDRLDLIHVQRATSLFGCRNTLLHVHDAMYASHPQLFPGLKRAIFNRLFRHSGARASQVLTPTVASKAEIVKHYRIDPAKIHLLPAVNLEGLGPEAESSRVARVLEQFGIRPPYVIFVGATERNKNLHVLIEAFALFLKGQPAYQLVLVGKWRAETRDGYVAELDRQIDEIGIRARVAFTGWVTNEQRRLLLCGASMLVFPSAAEGLGLPPLEAMACGVPAIASDIPSVREVYVDTLLFCRPNDPADLARRMAELASDPELGRRMATRGLEFANQDRWHSQAARLLDIYRVTAGLPATMNANFAGAGNK